MQSHIFPFLIITLLTTLSYVHTTEYPWHLDDQVNIVRNPPTQITELAPQTLWRSLFAHPVSGKLSRPVAHLSFALNYYFGKDDVRGYHAVNICIHIITGLLLYVSICLLLNSPAAKQPFSPRQVSLIALLAALLWALHPIQTQAVTYIVQRMASMAAMWSIACITLFLYSFRDLHPKRRLSILFLSLTCFLLALGSKENPVLLPISLLLIQLSFFKNDSRPLSRYLKWLLFIIVVFILLYAVYFLVSTGMIQQLTSSDYFYTRPYTAFERLFSQPRILLFYISLLLYPDPTRFSIDHSFQLSHSFLQPWTTLPAVIITISAFIGGLVLLKKRPLLGFPIVFFFINHMIESSIIPLELLFEHRNYLPSLFFFLPLSIGLFSLQNHLRTRFIQAAVCIFSVTLVLLFCAATYLRNTVWSSEERLWKDALSKAPENARPYSYLGRIYGWEKPKNEENLNKAIEYYKNAIGKYAPLRHFNAAIIGNIGSLYFNDQKYTEAAIHYKNALAMNPDYNPLRFGLAQTMIVQGKVEEALTHLDYVIDKDIEGREISRFYNLKGLALLWLHKPQQAQVAFSQAIIHSQEKVRFFYNLAVSSSHTGHYEHARRFFKAALRDTPTDIIIMFSIIENEIRDNNIEKAKKYAKNLYQVFNPDEIKAALTDKGIERRRYAPLDLERIRPFVLNQKMNLPNAEESP
ncbi:MAG: hypothetical protein CSA26_05210 [Desulfobacterales bacterium]|nr:MAG: hypothetical protein CSA26_05210 [Desulfobacterales bacterium]